MTEFEWLASTDPAAMLAHLNGPRSRSGFSAHTGRDEVVYEHPPSDRKLRLFAAGCCRQAWSRLTDERSRRAVEVAERYADGQATRQELGDARMAAAEASVRGWGAADLATHCAERHVGGRWSEAATLICNPDHGNLELPMADLLRCLFGNPFRPARLIDAALGERIRKATGWTATPPRGPEIDGALLAWNNGTASRLAQGIYDERRWEDLPILADALEEAGCDDEKVPCPTGCKKKGGTYRVADGSICPNCHGGTGCTFAENPLLTHLRGPGPHARGCWALDLILGKG